MKPPIIDYLKPVEIYLKPALKLEKGDKILTSRSTVATIENIETGHDNNNRLCIHIFCGHGGIPVTGLCLLADEEVLVIDNLL